MSWLVFRLVKFLAIAVFAAGIGGAVLSAKQRDRLRAAHGLATVGLFGTWMGGYGLMKATGLSFSEPWIGASLLASLLALQGALSAARSGRARVFGGGLAIAGLAGTTAAMVLRGAGPMGLLVAALVGVVAGVVAGAKQRGAESVDDGDVVGATRVWFTRIARLEGASLLFMLGVSMPLRKLAGIAIDGGQGWVGWVHGALTLLYVLALFGIARVEGWGAGRVATGFFASVVPFGTFWFERRLAPLGEPAPRA